MFRKESVTHKTLSEEWVDSEGEKTRRGDDDASLVKETARRRWKDPLLPNLTTDTEKMKRRKMPSRHPRVERLNQCVNDDG